MDRDVILREMGLTPVWRLRNPQPAPAGEPLAAPGIDALPAAAVEPLSEPPSVPVSEHRAGVATGEPRSWDALLARIEACRDCALGASRQRAVPGVGDRQADWLFVGEGPGAEEDARGEPFVGQAGKLLDNMLAAINLRRGEDVYIANAVKCRPPDNRTPEAVETAACFPYLKRQIELIQPKLIVALGKPAAQTLLNAEIKVGAERGRLHAYGEIPVIVTYHPAYLLRNLPDKAKAWEDLLFMQRTMRQLKGQ